MSTPDDTPKPGARELFLRALELDDPSDRKAFLDRECVGRPEMRARVAELLASHSEDSFLEEPAFQVSATACDGTVSAETTAQSPIELPSSIGPYKLLEKIGAGGMGEVYMAEQSEPIRRRVALKIVKLGMDTREVVARFEAERQALALMEHPNIAKVLDAGATETGRPYFVMELVHGIPITEYCDRGNLPMHERLSLFMQVCQATHHAHQKAVIHRDLKPTNVLVTEIDGEPVPKVIDFGVAKALGQKLTEKTLFTAFEKMIGTPVYMSPEQTALSGVDIDTRSDIYSLGVLLYELLAGVTPIDAETLRQAGLDEVRRMIRETEPPKPSTRLRTLGDKLPGVARRRHVEPSALARMVYGDLDWIVMKALEKDRGRRYETANALLEDIQRHLHHQPVLAGPPRAFYRAGKFVRRHRAGVTLAAALSAALVLGLIASLVGLAEVRRQRDRAREAEARAGEEAAISRAVNRFLRDDLLAQASPYEQPDREVSLRTLVDRAAAKVGARFAEQPHVELQIRRTLTIVYEALGDLEKARKQLERAKQISRDQNLPADNPKRLELENREANLLIDEGKHEEARKLAEELLPVRQRMLGPEHRQTLIAMFFLGNALASQKNSEEALRIYEKLLPLLERVRGSEDFVTLTTRNNLANVYSDLGEQEEARKIYEELLPVQEQVLGPESPYTLMSRYNLGNLASDQGRPEEAHRIYAELLPVQQRVLGPEHPHTLKTRCDLAFSLARLGKSEEARRVHETTIPMLERVHGREHFDTLNEWGHLANAYTDLGQHDEARNIYEEILPVLRRVHGPEHPVARIARRNLGLSYDLLGKPEEARTIYEGLLQVEQRLLGPEHPDTLRTRYLLADVYGQLGRLDESREVYEAIIPALERVHGLGHIDTLSARHNLGFSWQLQGKPEEACRIYEELLPVLDRVLGIDKPLALQTRQNLATVYTQLGKPDEARRTYQELLPVVQQVKGPAHSYTLDTQFGLAIVYMVLGQAGEARRIYEEILPVMQRVRGPEHNSTLSTKGNLGIATYRSGMLDEAREILEEVFPVMGRVLGPEHSDTVCVAKHLAEIKRVQAE